MTELNYVTINAFSKRDFEIYFFFYFKKTGFDISCKLLSCLFLFVFLFFVVCFFQKISFGISCNHGDNLHEMLKVNK